MYSEQNGGAGVKQINLPRLNPCRWRWTRQQRSVLTHDGRGITGLILAACLSNLADHGHWGVENMIEVGFSVHYADANE